MIQLEEEGTKAPTSWPLTGTWPSETHRSHPNTTTEVCVLNEEGEIVGGFANAEEAWAFTYRLLSELVRGQPSEWIQTPAIPDEVDAVGQEQAEVRQAVLQRRQEEQERHLERLKGSWNPWMRTMSANQGLKQRVDRLKSLWRIGILKSVNFLR